MNQMDEDSQFNEDIRARSKGMTISFKYIFMENFGGLVKIVLPLWPLALVFSFLAFSMSNQGLFRQSPHAMKGGLQKICPGSFRSARRTTKALRVSSPLGAKSTTISTCRIKLNHASPESLCLNRDDTHLVYPSRLQRI
ncbi:hypothetical protein F5148DRAFT_1149464 [Russula earlei]|uniref:Uncharacterized protein n=1 Tax=Russula earlei TaxID=71964 RepID=A0ACC0UAH6_9AGAM|nr:hypothetical protein F5148DRAFT_1149464 [Russula earlei]